MWPGGGTGCNRSWVCGAYTGGDSDADVDESDEAAKHTFAPRPVDIAEVCGRLDSAMLSSEHT